MLITKKKYIKQYINTKKTQKKCKKDWYGEL